MKRAALVAALVLLAPGAARSTPGGDVVPPGGGVVLRDDGAVPPVAGAAAAAPRPLPGRTPMPTLLFAALQDTPPASAGLTATCTSYTASLAVLTG